ncbi:MAG: plastocyanin, partial [Gemmatimonadetes bacterium]|nr:plastocyanin [Gemmatimonadota bacterium]
MSIRFWFALALVALPAVAGAATHTVTQNGITFEPADLTIAPGDTVMWVQTAGVHTVTHGIDDSDPPLGEKLFDAPLSTAEPTFL